VADLTVKLPGGGALVLTPHPTRAGHYKLRWQGDDEGIGAALAKAGPLVEGYAYSPADGYPGYLLAGRVALAVGGEAVLPPHPQVPPDATA